MPSANLEIVRSIYADWERGDYSSTDWAAPEIAFTIADAPTPATGTGPSGISQVWGDFLCAWENFRQQADDYSELDGDRVLVLTHFGGRGRLSGLDLEHMGTKGLVLFELDAGKVARMTLYLDRERGFEALGLRSPSSP